MPLFAEALALEVSAGAVILSGAGLATAIIVGCVVFGLIVRSAFSSCTQAVAESSKLTRQTNTLIRVLAARQGHAELPIEE